MIGHTLIGLTDGVFHYMFESQVLYALEGRGIAEIGGERGEIEAHRELCTSSAPSAKCE